MLSFNDGIHIAYAIKDKKKLYDIFIKKDNGSKSDIICQNITDILDNRDLKKVSRALRLNHVEDKVLKNALLNKTRDKLNDRLKNAYDTIMEVLCEKLKKEIEFDEDIEIIPSIGWNDISYDRSVFLVGPSNSGKSHLISEILEYDKRKRPIFLFTAESNSHDPVYQKLLYTEDDYKKMQDGKKITNNHRMTYIPIVNEDDLINIPNVNDIRSENGVICVFDDLEHFKSQALIYETLKNLMEDLLETSRKNNVTVLCAKHELSHSQSKVNINECQYLVLFPSSNQLLSEKFLKNALSIAKKQRDYIINKCSSKRRMIIKLSQPLACIHLNGVILLDSNI
jgi:hypothetical protein